MSARRSPGLQGLPPLPREEVIKAVERRSPCRIPMVLARSWGEGLVEQHGTRLDELERYPEDLGMLWIKPVRYDKMGLSWELPAPEAR